MPPLRCWGEQYDLIYRVKGVKIGANARALRGLLRGVVAQQQYHLLGGGGTNAAATEGTITRDPPSFRHDARVSYAWHP